MTTVCNDYLPTNRPLSTNTPVNKDAGAREALGWPLFHLHKTQIVLFTRVTLY